MNVISLNKFCTYIKKYPPITCLIWMRVIRRWLNPYEISLQVAQPVLGSSVTLSHRWLNPYEAVRTWYEPWYPMTHAQSMSYLAKNKKIAAEDRPPGPQYLLLTKIFHVHIIHLSVCLESPVTITICIGLVGVSDRIRSTDIKPPDKICMVR